MKLFLSSWDPEGAPSELRTLVGDNPSCALIVNATDGAPTDFRDALLSRARKYLEAIGLEPFELDLRDHLDDGDGIAARLADCGLVWAHGGNAFVLRSAMRRSGFDASIPSLLASTGLVYGGCSAGAIVAGTTLRGIELVDPLDELEVSGGQIVWEGLGLVDFAIAPHYRSAAPMGTDIDALIARMVADDTDHRALRDGETIQIHGSAMTRIDHSAAVEAFISRQPIALT